MATYSLRRVPIEEDERKRRNKQERQHDQPKVARVAARRVDVRIAAHQILGRRLRVLIEQLDLARLLLNL